MKKSFMDKSCGVVGCTNTVVDRVLLRKTSPIPTGFVSSPSIISYRRKHKLTNFEYLCTKHWREITHIHTCITNIENEVERYDECLCCDPYKTKYQTACLQLEDFKKKLKRNFGRYI